MNAVRNTIEYNFHLTLQPKSLYIYIYLSRIMQINVEIKKRHLYLILALVVFLAGVMIVIAANPSSKPNPGHASNEVMVNINSVDKTLQQAIDDKDFGSIYSCHWEKSWKSYPNEGANIPEKTQCNVGTCMFKVDCMNVAPSNTTYKQGACGSPQTCGQTTSDNNEFLYCCSQ